MLSPRMRETLESFGVLSSEWPNWAVDIFVSLSLCCTVLVTGQSLYDRRSYTAPPRDGRDASMGKNGYGAPTQGQVSSARFRRFQYKYLAVYLIVMLADWLQGTNMYTLYQSYDMDVGTLFLTGFSSAAVFGTFLGLFVDRFGRRNGCIVFCLLEVVINTLEHIPDMRLLLLGRVLGGISTSLLFSAFESWMVSEHRKQGFPEEWLASTFSAATVGNGIMAVLAGVVAQVSSDKLGDIGPFQVAIALTLISLGLLLMWEENYGYGEEISTTSEAFTASATGNNGGASTDDGEECSSTTAETSTKATAANGANGANGNGVHNSEGGKGVRVGGDGRAPGLRESISLAWRCIVSDDRVLLLGLVQSLFEGGTFTFVFMWVPTLQGVVPGGVLPTGLIFSSFMVCITIGGVVFSAMLRKMTVESASVLVFFVAAAAMALPAATRDFPTILIAFLVLETCVGAFYSCSGLMRSRYIPGALQSSVMNIFRLPLNLLVVVGTRVTDVAQTGTVFLVIASWFAASALLQLRLSACARRDTGDIGEGVVAAGVGAGHCKGEKRKSD